MLRLAGRQRPTRPSILPNRAAPTLLWVAAALFVFGPLAAAALETESKIPAFARKYGISCSLCHTAVPSLNDFGETFAGNGFQLNPDEVPPDTVQVGDDLLRLQDHLPLAVRIDLYLQSVQDRGDVVASDLATPWGIKLLSGGQVADGISYYMYFYLSEHGEVAGLEDAYLHFVDPGGLGVDFLVGQFQVSDPLFKRELRLEYEDYQLYRARLGNARADLAYDRGIMAAYSPWEGGDLVVQVVNGRGLGEANEELRYDDDQGKNVMVRYSHDFGPVRLGGFFYGGRERAEGVSDDIRIFGPDLTLELGAGATVNVEYFRRVDDNPFFLTGCALGDFRCDPDDADPFETTLDAFMAEVIWFPGGTSNRWFFTALYDDISVDRPALSLRIGEQDEGVGFLEEYRAAAFGTNYMLRRNVRLTGEIQWNFESERSRLTLGIVSAF